MVCRELVGGNNKLIMVLYVFKHEMQHILIHALYTHIVVFWHINNIPLSIS